MDEQVLFRQEQKQDLCVQCAEENEGIRASNTTIFLQVWAAIIEIYGTAGKFPSHE